MKSLIEDMYLTFFDDASGSEELIKNIVQSTEFLQSCCKIEDKQPPSATKAVTVLFADDTTKTQEDLQKTGSIARIINVISNSVSDFLKHNHMSDMLKRCETYYNFLHRYGKILPFNFDRLSRLQKIMKDMIDYDIATNKAYEWAVTSFLFHIVYVYATSTISHHHNISVITSPLDSDVVTQLSDLFESKREFMNRVMTHILPKLLSIHTQSIDNKLLFNNQELQQDESNSLIQLLTSYTSETLTPNKVEDYISRQGHSIIRHMTIYSGSKSDVVKGIVSTVVADPTKTTTPHSLTKSERLYAEKESNMRTAVIMKLFEVLEHWAQAYKDKKPGANYTINVHTNLKSIKFQNGILEVNNK